MTTNLANRVLHMTALAERLRDAAPVSLDAGRATAIAAELLTPRRRAAARRALLQVLLMLEDDHPMGGPLDRRATGECGAPSEGMKR